MAIAVATSLVAATAAHAQRAGGRVITGLDVTGPKDCTALRVDFSLPMRYLEHFPPHEGDDIRVKVMPVAVSDEERDSVRVRESARLSTPDARVPLQEVTFDGTIENVALLTFDFERPVTFSMDQGEDFRSLVLFVHDPKSDLPCPRPEAFTERTVPEAEAIAPKAGEERQARIMAEARREMTAGHYDRVVALCTKLLEYAEHSYSREALELLGLARERKGQLAHAKAEYERYLQRYPSGPGADRVRQRLAGILTAAEPGREKLRRPTARRGASQWQTYGSLSQFYQRSASFTDGGDSLDQSVLASDLNATVRSRGPRRDLRAQFTGGYLADFIDTNEGRVSELYFDALDRPTGLSGRVGRQSRSSGGVLGRFDGLLASYRASSHLELNVVGGFPVDFSNLDSFETDRRFYGLSLDLGTFAERWDFTLFFIDQYTDGISDRRAVGAEGRYLDAKRSLFTLVDYDVAYNQLNVALLLANVTFATRTQVNLTVDYRKSPILTTTNALIGQTAGSISELRQTYTEEEIRQLAEDRTADTQSYAIGLSQPINGKFRVSGDVLLSRLSSTPASGGVEATPSTGNELFYSAQLIGSDLIKPGDITIFGLRFSDGNTSNTVSGSINTRYPITRELRFNPRLRLDYRWNENDSGEQFAVQPSARLEYIYHRVLHLEVEAGAEWASERFADQSDQPWGYFVNVGYRWDF
jgi:tetratricopeptide (TPR) repeat protein